MLGRLIRPLLKINISEKRVVVLCFSNSEWRHKGVKAVEFNRGQEVKQAVLCEINVHVL